MNKICLKCKVSKILGEFSKDRSRKDGLDKCCKRCKKEYRLAHLEQTTAYNKEYFSKNKEKKAIYDKGYYSKNRLKIISQITIYRSKRIETDIQFRLSCLLRIRLGKAIKRNQKKGSAVRDLGCTISELKIYLEGQFQDGMTWENWSHTGWHIDHKIPLTFYDLTNREQLLQAVHYTNLQPMWAKENLSKGGGNRMVFKPIRTVLLSN